MNAVVNSALRDDLAPRKGPLSQKRLDDYAAKSPPAPGEPSIPPIHVLLAVVDLAEGKFKVLPGSWRVVDGLTAALATVPLFPPVACDDSERRRISLLIDASIVANEPTRPLFSFLRSCNLVNEEAAALHLYSVAALPFSRESLGEEPAPDRKSGAYTTLVEAARRAWEIKRFRDASLERPLRVTERMLQQEDEAERRRIIAETVADGCRAALQVMLQPTIADLPKPLEVQYDTLERMRFFATGKPVQTVRCGAAIHARLGAEPLPGSAAKRDQGSMESLGPGLAEVCQHCAFYRDPVTGIPPQKQLARALRVLDPKQLGRRPWPKAGWPQEGKADLPWTEQGRLAAAEVEPSHLSIREQQWQGRWPLERGGAKGHERPTVSLLFSGGVFRGVFQVGALNALSEASLVPDLVAGASVGSITAAMVARAFLRPDDASPEAALAERRRQVLRVAATYLGIDRLVLTDRFADFIRGVTVRAAQAQFSIRDAD